MEKYIEFITLLAITIGGIILLSEFFYHVITNCLKHKSHPPTDSSRVDKKEEDTKRFSYASHLLVFFLTNFLPFNI